jgi:hypothetical protein
MPHERHGQFREGIAASPVYRSFRYQAAVLKDDFNNASMTAKQYDRLGYAVADRPANNPNGGA